MLCTCLANVPLNKWLSPLKAQGLDASGVCASVPEVPARQIGVQGERLRAPDAIVEFSVDLVYC